MMSNIQCFRITKDLAKRAKLIQETHYRTLKTEVKEKMAKTPQMGLVCICPYHCLQNVIQCHKSSTEHKVMGITYPVCSSNEAHLPSLVNLCSFGMLITLYQLPMEAVNVTLTTCERYVPFVTVRLLQNSTRTKLQSRDLKLLLFTQILSLSFKKQNRSKTAESYSIVFNFILFSFVLDLACEHFWSKISC